MITLFGKIAFDKDEQKLMESKQTLPTVKCYKITGYGNEIHTMTTLLIFTITPPGFICNSIVKAADSSPRSMLHMMDSYSNMLDEALYENE